MFAQEALVQETSRLHKFALRLTRNRSDADDLTQSTCLRALEKSSYFEDGSNLHSWTSKLMFNLFVTDYRRRQKFESRSDPENALMHLAIGPTQEIKTELQKVQKIISTLSADHRDVINLICVQGRSYNDVAASLGVPVGTVRSRLSRAREKINAVISAPDMVLTGIKVAQITESKIAA